MHGRLKEWEEKHNSYYVGIPHTKGGCDSPRTTKLAAFPGRHCTVADIRKKSVDYH